MILNMPREKHKHDKSQASREPRADAQYSFVSVTHETQIISATLWLVESVGHALYNVDAATPRNFIRALAAQEQIDG